MKTIRLFFLVLTIAAGCSSSKQADYPDDFSATYSVNNALRRTEAKINITKETIFLSFKDNMKTQNISENYTVDVAEVNKLYKYMQSVSFMNMTSPVPEQMMDAPTVSLKEIYNNKANEVFFGSVKTVPVELEKIRKMVLDLAAKYGSTNWKTNAIF